MRDHDPKRLRLSVEELCGMVEEWRVERDGDLFAPVLTLQQKLPQFGKEQS